MIKQLRIKNYILIDDLTCDFDEKLNVITGETGAGKSIIINAIELAFSTRVSREVIKSGEDKAFIELTIDNKKHNLNDFFAENGIDSFDNEIILSKEITQNGARTRINGTMVNGEVVKYLKNMFLDIHSQHQTYSFLQPKCHINLLDEYAKSFYGEKLDKYKLEYQEYTKLKNDLENLKNAAQMTESQIEFLKFQLNEIDDAQILSINEDEELRKELEILENAEKLKELTGTSYWAINGDDNSILDSLNDIRRNISKAAETDANLTETEQSINEAVDILITVGGVLREYSQNLDNDEARLNEIQERLYLLDKLKHKYGNTLETVLETGENLRQELDGIEFSTQNIENLETEISLKHNELEILAQEISEARKNYAKVLSVLTEEKMQKLELPKARFLIDVKPKELSSDGIDDVEFLISTNVSEDLKPLAKVASGGEISRVMLSLKSVFAQSDGIDTVIFDEIDTGISGKASQSVAEEISELANSHQIILITHQPIIASKANKHFYVRKSQNDITKVEVYTLNENDRIMALAELAGGEINDKSIEFAKSLL